MIIIDGSAGNINMEHKYLESYLIKIKFCSYYMPKNNYVIILLIQVNLFHLRYQQGADEDS